MVRRSVVHVGARGFEPPTSWSQTTRSTKLSYAPNTQRVVYHGFCSRASGRAGSPLYVDGSAPTEWSPYLNVTPDSARAVFPLRIRLRLAGPRNQLLDRVRSVRPRNISNPGAKNTARSRWRQ